jgi:hypothetical protein
MIKAVAIFVLASLGLVQGAMAYFVAIPGYQGPVDYNKVSRLLVSGRGTDLGLQPQLSATGRAQLYRRNSPNDQLVLISVLENDKNEALLLKNGWVFLVKNDLKFETEVASKEILKFNRIRSLEFFGHNSPTLGTQSDGLGFRFDFRKPVVAKIASHFVKGAYAMIHGCNSGWISAPALAKTWGIAVAGSLTGTRFERLHSNGHFYVADDNKAPNANWASTNPDLDIDNCWQGGCWRMRPQYTRYKGKWGDFTGPLLMHYKFFCPNDVAACEKSMAMSLYGFLAEKSLQPNSSYTEFREVAKEFLCPLYKDRVITEECLSELDKIEAGTGNTKAYYSINDAQLTCNFQSCTGKMTCDDHTCTVEGRQSKNSETLAQEYLHFLNGFKVLQQEGM